jgi:hypothetical protein
VVVLTARFPRNTSGDRRGRVTRVTETQIFIRTRNGRNTWRAPRNLRFATDRELREGTEQGQR